MKVLIILCLVSLAFAAPHRQKNQAQNSDNGPRSFGEEEEMFEELRSLFDTRKKGDGSGPHAGGDRGSRQSREYTDGDDEDEEEYSGEDGGSEEKGGHGGKGKGKGGKGKHLKALVFCLVSDELGGGETGGETETGGEETGYFKRHRKGKGRGRGGKKGGKDGHRGPPSAEECEEIFAKAKEHLELDADATNDELKAAVLAKAQEKLGEKFAKFQAKWDALKEKLQQGGNKEKRSQDKPDLPEECLEFFEQLKNGEREPGPPPEGCPRPPRRGGNNEKRRVNDDDDEDDEEGGRRCGKPEDDEDEETEIEEFENDDDKGKRRRIKCHIRRLRAVGYCIRQALGESGPPQKRHRGGRRRPHPPSEEQCAKILEKAREKLGVGEDATIEEVKEAFKAKIQEVKNKLGDKVREKLEEIESESGVVKREKPDGPGRGPHKRSDEDDDEGKCRRKDEEADEEDFDKADEEGKGRMVRCHLKKLKAVGFCIRKALENGPPALQKRHRKRPSAEKCVEMLNKAREKLELGPGASIEELKEAFKAKIKEIKNKIGGEVREKLEEIESENAFKRERSDEDRPHGPPHKRERSGPKPGGGPHKRSFFDNISEYFF